MELCVPSARQIDPGRLSIFRVSAFGARHCEKGHFLRYAVAFYERQGANENATVETGVDFTVESGEAQLELAVGKADFANFYAFLAGD